MTLKQIMITGASDGIGLEVAKLLARDNHLTLVARNKEKLEKALSSLKGNGHELIVADLSVKEHVYRVKEKIETGHFDVLINNAGVGMYGRFTEIPLLEQMKMLDLNITSLTGLSYSFLKHARSGDALINTASTLGTTSYAGGAVYAASKAYVTNLSESLWWEYRSKGILVLGFSPGATYTNFHNSAGGDKESFPKFVMQSPQDVAKEMVAALRKRSGPKVVSGGMNRAMLFFQRFMSRRMVVKMMAGFGPLKGK